MSDDFLSVEHFLLAAIADSSPAGSVLKDAGATEEKFTAGEEFERGSGGPIGA